MNVFLHPSSLPDEEEDIYTKAARSRPDVTGHMPGAAAQMPAEYQPYPGGGAQAGALKSPSGLPSVSDGRYKLPENNGPPPLNELGEEVMRRLRGREPLSSSSQRKDLLDMLQPLMPGQPRKPGTSDQWRNQDKRFASRPDAERSNHPGTGNPETWKGQKPFLPGDFQRVMQAPPEPEIEDDMSQSQPWMFSHESHDPRIMLLPTRPFAGPVNHIDPSQKLPDHLYPGPVNRDDLSLKLPDLVYPGPVNPDVRMEHLYASRGQEAQARPTGQPLTGPAPHGSQTPQSHQGGVPAPSSGPASPGVGGGIESADEQLPQEERQRTSEQAREDEMSGFALGMQTVIEEADWAEAFEVWRDYYRRTWKREPDQRIFTEGRRHAMEALAPHLPQMRQIVDIMQRSQEGVLGKATEEELKYLKRFQDTLVDMDPQLRSLVLGKLARSAQAAGQKVKKGIDAGGGTAGQFLQNTTGEIQKAGEGFSRFLGKAGKHLQDTDAIFEHLDENGLVYTSLAKIDTPEKARYLLDEWLVLKEAGGLSGFLMQGNLVDPGKRIEIKSAHSDWRKLTPEEAALVKEQKDRAMLRNSIGRAFQAITESTDPAEGFSAALGQSAGVLGLLAGTRGRAAPLLWQARTGEVYEHLRQQGVPPTSARNIAEVTGAAQLLLDRFELKALGHMPNLKALFGGGIQNVLQTLPGNAGRVAGIAALEQVKNGVGDLVQPTVQDVFAALDKDMKIPGVNWSEELKMWKDSRLETLLVSLPLMLLGSGARTHADIKNARDHFLSNDTLALLGVVEADRRKIMQAADSGSLDTAQDLLRQAWQRRDGAVAAEYQDRLGQQELEAFQAQEGGLAERMQVKRRPLIPENATNEGVPPPGQPLPGHQFMHQDLARLRAKAKAHAQGQAGPLSLAEQIELDRHEKDLARIQQANLETEQRVLRGLSPPRELDTHKSRVLKDALAAQARHAPMDPGPPPPVPQARTTIESLGKRDPATLTQQEAHQLANAQRAIARKGLDNLSAITAGGGTLSRSQQDAHDRFQSILNASRYNTGLPAGPPAGYDPTGPYPNWYPPKGSPPSIPPDTDFNAEGLALSGEDIRTSMAILSDKEKGHAASRHGPGVTEGQLQDRTMYGVDPITQTREDGEHGGDHQAPRTATQFTSERAMVQAYKAVAGNADFKDAIKAAKEHNKNNPGNPELTVVFQSLTLESVLGPAYQKHVRGRTRVGSANNPTGYAETNLAGYKIKAVFKLDRATGEYVLHTMFPNKP